MVTQGGVHHSSTWQGQCSKFLSNEEKQVYHLTKWTAALSLLEWKVLGMEGAGWSLTLGSHLGWSQHS